VIPRGGCSFVIMEAVMGRILMGTDYLLMRFRVSPSNYWWDKNWYYIWYVWLGLNARHWG